MKPKITWILVADGARARLLKSEGWGHGLEAVGKGEYEGDRRKTHEIGVEPPGRGFESADQSRHALAPRVDWHQFAEAEFAREMAEILNRGRLRGSFDRLALVAPPKALGDLRRYLDDNTARMVIAELDKDLTHVAIHDLPEHLEKVMPV